MTNNIRPTAPTLGEYTSEAEEEDSEVLSPELGLRAASPCSWSTTSYKEPNPWSPMSDSESELSYNEPNPWLLTFDSREASGYLVSSPGGLSLVELYGEFNAEDDDSPPEYHDTPSIDAGRDDVNSFAIPMATEDETQQGDDSANVESQSDSGASDHRNPQPQSHRESHLFLTGDICNKSGLDLDKGTPPPPRETDSGPDDWSPYNSRVEFELADFLYSRNQMSGGDIDVLLSLWAASLAPYDAAPPFRNHDDLYHVIDSTTLGDAAFNSFPLHYNGELPDGPVPTWMSAEYEIWFRDPKQLLHNLISNPDFKDEFDYAPYHQYEDKNRQYSDFMSGNWAWKQADEISEDEETHGSMFVPIILGSDKTTVSVATGNNEYWPIYMSIGNIHNNTRRSHRNGVVLLGFHAIPKSEKQDADCAKFRKFRRQLFHATLTKILQPLKPLMSKPEVVRCADDHYRRVIYGIGPYIADYPEQCLLCAIVQGWCPKCTTPPSNLDSNTYGLRHLRHTVTLLEELQLGELWDEYGLVGDIVPFTEDFPRADIYELISPDLLHQLIKGTFKDHMVTWIQEFLVNKHGEAQAKKILDDIDRRIAIVPPFSGLRRFPQGRGFKQWTGDDSKALMKVYLPAIEGYVPDDMVRTLRALLEFIYLARRNIHTRQTIREMENALERFQKYRSIFVRTGVRPENSTPPRQHSLAHYIKSIKAFGAPNGLCSSITESKHIKAIKEPWRRSNHYNALGQMLLTNQRLDKLAASRTDFARRGMLKGACLGKALKRLGVLLAKNSGGTLSNQSQVDSPSDCSKDSDDSEVPGPKKPPSICLTKRPTRSKINVDQVSRDINEPNLQDLITTFVSEQVDRNSIFFDYAPTPNGANESLTFPRFSQPISTFPSAVVMFHAPSDICGTGGMRAECIRAISTWRGTSGRYDCILIRRSSTQLDDLRGFQRYSVACVRLFFTFTFLAVDYSCALVHDFLPVDEEPDQNTGMWVVRRATLGCRPRARVIPLHSILRAAHLIPVYGYEETMLLKTRTPETSLDDFEYFYMNKFADHHAFEVAF